MASNRTESSFRPSAACCSTPAIIGPTYETQGHFINVDGMQTYVTGADTATRALFVIYDVFGFSHQILEGADRLASQSYSGFRVFMPDFFHGKPAPLTWMPMPDPISKKEPAADDEALTKFCEGPGNTTATVARVLALQKTLQTANACITAWGLVGYCWGGYVANFLLGPQTPFAACAELHPGFPDADVARTVSSPLLALCSKDEPASEYANFQPHLTCEARFEHFPDMVHGWMSARGDLSNVNVRKEFERGYTMLSEFFDAHIRP